MPGNTLQVLLSHWNLSLAMLFWRGSNLDYSAEGVAELERFEQFARATLSHLALQVLTHYLCVFS